ncbi:MAG: spermidine/putrescine ABC transporter permease PotC [marine bacterium B5-7]|nr:MAG: spermidine/putrescine ABC transporter permease PotC [marine bacterium B5-7]
MNRFLPKAYLSLVYLFLYLPIIIMIIYAFNNTNYPSSHWYGGTLHWFRALKQDSQLITNTLHSLTVASLASSIAVFFGAIISFALLCYRFAGRKVLKHTLLIYIVLPDILIATALFTLFHLFHFPTGFMTLLIGHILLCLPFVVMMLNSRLHDLDPYLFEAAKDLGASDWIVFIKVLLPLAMPAILAGWLLSFTLSLDDVIISFFLTGPSYQVLSLYIYSMVKVGVSPEINAICAVLFGFSLFLVASATALMRRPS